MIEGRSRPIASRSIDPDLLIRAVRFLDLGSINFDRTPQSIGLSRSRLVRRSIQHHDRPGFSRSTLGRRSVGRRSIQSIEPRSATSGESSPRLSRSRRFRKLEDRRIDSRLPIRTGFAQVADFGSLEGRPVAPEPPVRNPFHRSFVARNERRIRPAAPIEPALFSILFSRPQSSVSHAADSGSGARSILDLPAERVQLIRCSSIEHDRRRIDRGIRLAAPVEPALFLIFVARPRSSVSDAADSGSEARSFRDLRRPSMELARPVSRPRLRGVSSSRLAKLGIVRRRVQIVMSVPST